MLYLVRHGAIPLHTGYRSPFPFWLGGIGATGTGRTGTLTGTEGADTAALTGTVLIQGALSGTEGADSAALTGTSGNIVARTAPDVDGKRRRARSGDEELTEAEVQFMRRKLRELRQAKTQRDKDAARKSIEVALAQAAQDEAAAEAIRRAAGDDPAALLRSNPRLARLVEELELIARERDDDDVETLLMLL